MSSQTCPLCNSPSLHDQQSFDSHLVQHYRRGTEGRRNLETYVINEHTLEHSMEISLSKWPDKRGCPSGTPTRWLTRSLDWAVVPSTHA